MTATRDQARDFQSILDGVIKQRFQETAEIFSGIITFDDLKTKLLMGTGDSKHTYRSYMTAADHTEFTVENLSTDRDGTTSS